MPDVLLIQPPIRDFYLTLKRTVPYGLACVAASLLHNGFSVEILDALASRRVKNIALPPEMAHLKAFYPQPDVSPFSLFERFKHFGRSCAALAEKARSSGAWLIGISSLFTPYAREALETAEAIRAAMPHVKIVLGGHHPTALPEEVMQNRAVDFVLRGDGELTLPILARALRDGTDLADIPGLVWRDADNRLRSKEVYRLHDLDAVPLPAGHLIDQTYYKRHDGGSAVVVASRGCPLNCSYCCMRRGNTQKYVQRSVASVLAEIDQAVTRHRAGFIDFEDENLSMNRKWFQSLLKEIASRYANRGLELRAMNGLFPPALDDELISLMAQSGFKTLNLSLGSSRPAQLKRFQRPDVRDAFDQALDSAERYGLQAVGYVIAGAPHQQAEDSLADLFYLAKRRVLAGVSIFYPSPGTPDFERCKALGVLPADKSLMRSSALPIGHTTRRKDAATILRLARILNFMKALLDQGGSISRAESYDAATRLDPKNRLQTGQKLLSWFLSDGQIRGVRPDGTVYHHNVSRKLTQRFIEGLKTIRIRGCK
jgi:tRNA A37 methylthiotransferase MiaB